MDFKRLGVVLSVSLAATTIAYSQSGPGSTSTPSEAGQRFRARLNGAEETPPNATSATGESTVFVEDNDEIDFTLSASGLADITAAHIHAGAEGQAGPIIFTLAAGSFSSPLSGELEAEDFTPAPDAGVETFQDAVDAIRGGNAYVNVHSSAFPNGEIRGQLRPDPQAGATPFPTGSPTGQATGTSTPEPTGTSTGSY